MKHLTYAMMIAAFGMMTLTGCETSEQSAATAPKTIAAPESQPAKQPTPMPTKEMSATMVWVMHPQLQKNLPKEAQTALEKWAQNHQLSFSVWSLDNSQGLFDRLQKEPTWPTYVIIDGLEHANVLKQLNAFNHSTTWLVADAFDQANHVVSIDFNLPQALFISGIIAAGKSRTHTIGIITPEDGVGAQKMELAFRAGVEFFDPTAEVLYDPLQEKTTVQQVMDVQLKDGADVTLCGLVHACFHDKHELALLYWSNHASYDKDQAFSPMQRNWLEASQKIISFLQKESPETSVIRVGNVKQAWHIQFPSVKNAWGSKKISQRLDEAITAMEKDLLVIPNQLVHINEPPTQP
jgi:hypothetical protein